MNPRDKRKGEVMYICLMINMVEPQQGPLDGSDYYIVWSSLECGLGGVSITSWAWISQLSYPLVVVYFKADL